MNAINNLAISASTIRIKKTLLIKSKTRSRSVFYQLKFLEVQN